MFNLKRKPIENSVIPAGERPGKEVKQRAWVVILSDGRVGYIDHYKSDGRFGVRPVQMSGLHYPNPSPHWTDAQRIAFPEEIALSLKDFRAANSDELPPEFRH